jgi:hypothetical protein
VNLLVEQPWQSRDRTPSGTVAGDLLSIGWKGCADLGREVVALVARKYLQTFVQNHEGPRERPERSAHAVPRFFTLYLDYCT